MDPHKLMIISYYHGYRKLHHIARERGTSRDYCHHSWLMINLDYRKSLIDASWQLTAQIADFSFYDYYCYLDQFEPFGIANTNST